jgi:hypothetical protein
MNKRNCVEVIDAMLVHIPSENTEFITMLNSVRKDAQYKAPEETIQWQHLTVTVGSFVIPPFTKDWELEVLSLLTTVPVAELKAGIATEDAATKANNEAKAAAEAKAVEEAKAAEQK